MIADLIELELSLNGQPLIRLTEHTIQGIDFITAKNSDHPKQTKDIALRLKFENASILFRDPPDNSDGDEGEEDAELKPDELDSVRNLLVYAVSTYKKRIAYLDGEIKIGNELVQSAHFSYKNLFVISCSEEYAEATRNTFVNILLREKAR